MLSSSELGKEQPKSIEAKIRKMNRALRSRTLRCSRSIDDFGIVLIPLVTTKGLSEMLFEPIEDSANLLTGALIKQNSLLCSRLIGTRPTFWIDVLLVRIIVIIDTC